MESHGNWRWFILGIALALAITAARPAIAQQAEADAPDAPPPLDYALFNQPGPRWLPGADFSGQDLYGIDLAGANLRAANFDNTSLANADLAGALLVLATLRDADLTKANLRQATLSLADLRGANLPGADLSAADMQGALLNAANLDGARLARADLRQSDLKRASLRHANLTDVQFSGSNLQGADLSEADLSRADLSSVNLAGANLAGTILDDVTFDRVTVWPQNFDVQTMTMTGPSSPRTERPQSGEEELAITMTLTPALTDWFKRVARPGDTSLIDRAQDVRLLDEMMVGNKMVVFKSVDMAAEIVPYIADKFDTIGYNLEHGPLTPQHEQADPVGSVQRMRALADEYGLKLALGPDHNFALSHGEAMAPYVDIYAMQVQRIQSQPQGVREFVVPMAAAVRAANPGIETSLQVRTEGEAEEIAALIDSVRASIDGVAILSSPDTVETAYALVDLLHGEGPATAHGAANTETAAPIDDAAQNSPTWSFVLGIALQFLVIGLLALALVVIGRAIASRVQE